MRFVVLFLFYALTPSCLGGCSLGALEEPFDEERCTWDGDDSIARRIDPGPDCNGAKHAHECASVGLPSGYGVELGCINPAMRTSSQALCKKRNAGLHGCVSTGRIVCCP